MATLSTEESVVPSEQTERLAGETEDEKLPSRGAPPEKAGENVELNPETPGGRVEVEVKTENAGGESGEVNPAAKEAVEETAAPAQDDQKLPPEAGRAEEGGRIRPAGCTGTGDKNSGKEMKAERGAEESQSSLIIDPVKGKRLGDKSLRRTSLEVSSSDGEPLSRMDSHSEDSISSTLLDMESGVSSGRSTPAEMADQTSAASSSSSSAKSAAGYPCCWEPRPPRCHGNPHPAEPCPPRCHGNAEPCPRHFLTSPDLAEHIRSVHVDGQTGGVFVCLWRGCKVYNTPSTSQSWLQRHMLTHSGDKPFKCVVGGCNATFASQGGLARHVPTHFSSQGSSKLANQSRVKEESPSKAGLNKRRKLKNKRRRSLPRPHDFFDAQTMDAIRHRAICLNLATHIESLGNGHSVVFHSTVIARRKEDSGKVKVLLHWTPEDILPDTWVNETERSQQKTKVVHLSQLPTDTTVLLDPNIYRMLF